MGDRGPAAAGGRVGEASQRPICGIRRAFRGAGLDSSVVNARNHGLLESSVGRAGRTFVPPEAASKAWRALVNAVATRRETEATIWSLSIVPAADKVANRFSPVSGFTSSVTRRVVPTTVLRRKAERRRGGCQGGRPSPYPAGGGLIRARQRVRSGWRRVVAATGPPVTGSFHTGEVRAPGGLVAQHAGDPRGAHGFFSSSSRMDDLRVTSVLPMLIGSRTPGYPARAPARWWWR